MPIPSYRLVLSCGGVRLFSDSETVIGAPRRLGSLLSRLVEVYRILGFRLLWEGPKHLVRPVYLVVAKDFSKIGEVEHSLSSIPPPPGVRFSALGETDLETLHRLDPRLPPEEARRRLQTGESCVLCWMDGELAHYRWDFETTAQLPFPGASLRLLDSDVFNSESFTALAYRRRGLQHLTAVAAYRKYRDRGFHRYLAAVAPWNRASMAGTLKRGFQIVGSIGCWRLGHKRRYFATGQVRLIDHATFFVEPEGRLGAKAQTEETH